jgi:hypothetical protein
VLDIFNDILEKTKKILDKYVISHLIHFYLKCLDLMKIMGSDEEILIFDFVSQHIVPEIFLMFSNKNIAWTIKGLF